MTNDATGPVLDGDGLPVPDPNFEVKRKEAVLAFFAGETDDQPGSVANMTGWFRDLSARIPGLLVTSAGGACPFQSEGTLHGLDYYFRYRHGYASLAVGGDVFGGPLYSAGAEYGQELDGFLDRDEFIDLMIQLVPRLDRAAVLWEFAGVKVTVIDAANPRPQNWEDQILRRDADGGDGNPTKPERNQPDLRFTATDEPEVYRAWGLTPQDAYARLHETSDYLAEHGWDAEAQATCTRLKAIDPTPLNRDERVFPDPAPRFEVRP